ncbi:MAG: hypothetical protein LBV04_08205 [Deferribacteraceae bacterium]|jgi:hypothetical protein|nr:hypothetical protein [Deferribacteraceae bacterium]
MKKYLILALMLSAFVLACGEGGYPDFMKDDGSDEATTEEMEMALDDKEYDKIISKFEGSEAGLNNRQKYLLQCAYMGKAGFDPLANLDQLLDDSDVDPMSALLGSQEMTKADAAANSGLYGDAAAIHLDHNPDMDEDIMLAGSIASALRMVTGFSAIGSCSTIDFNNKDAIKNCLPSSTAGIDSAMIAMINESLTIMRELADPSNTNTDGKVKEKINEILAQIDGGGGSAEQNVLDYLNTEVFN